MRLIESLIAIALSRLVRPAGDRAKATAHTNSRFPKLVLAGREEKLL
jgi:hypothetical protein